MPRCCFVLYIPIWLYSNFALIPFSISVNFLYIPIWLYSNYNRLNHYRRHRNLYIPIWLYSNASNRCSSLTKFQLYIPIWLYSNCMLSVSQYKKASFTFQSGYIQIITAVDTFLGVLSLHSNLVIFK